MLTGQAVQTCVRGGGPFALVVICTPRQRDGSDAESLHISSRPPQLFLDECLSGRGVILRPNHGPACDGAEPPVRGPDHRPGSAACQQAKGEQHFILYSSPQITFEFSHKRHAYM